MSLPRELEFSTDVTRHERGFCLARVRDMVRIRRLEERCAQLYGEQKIRGFLHLYVGEEAVAAGVMPQLQPQDNVVATYREHGHALLRGVSMNAIMAEMYGKQEGCSRGRGGSMHLFDRATRFFGGNAIVGGGLPLATGLALADKLAPRPGCVTACFLARAPWPRAPSTSRSTWPRCGGCRCSSSARTTLRHGHGAGALRVQHRPHGQGGDLRPGHRARQRHERAGGA